jgi:transposase-like protein
MFDSHCFKGNTHDTDDGLAFRGSGKLTPDQDEVKKLKAQVKRLEMEKNILKKETNGAPYRILAAKKKLNIRSSPSIRIPI